MERTALLSMMVLLMLTGCQINLFDKSITPTPTSNGRATGTFLIDGWRIDTAYRGTNYKSYISQFVNEQVGYIASVNYADILKTTDGGLTWTTQPTPLVEGRAYPRDIEFIDENTGFISYHNTEGCPTNCRRLYSLLTTINGGKTWTVVQAKEQGTLQTIHFTSANNGVAVATEGVSSSQLSPVLLHTTDGGKSWQKDPGFAPDVYSNGLYFLNAQVGYLTNSQLKTVSVTSDGGQTWQFVSSALPADVSYQPFLFTDAQKGFVAGYNGLYRTTDGGRNWATVWTGSTNLIGFVNAREGFAVRTVTDYPNDVPDADRELRHTLDGGQTWKAYPQVYNLDVSPVQFVSDRVGYGTRGNMVLKWSRR